MTFEVKRSEWVRGGIGVSALHVRESSRRALYPDRQRCCLGFFANACGIPDSELENLSAPAMVEVKLPQDAGHEAWNGLLEGRALAPLYRQNSRLCQLIMACNDQSGDHDTTARERDNVRELQLTKLFQELDHTVVFVD